MPQTMPLQPADGDRGRLLLLRELQAGRVLYSARVCVKPCETTAISYVPGALCGNLCFQSDDAPYFSLGTACICGSKEDPTCPRRNPVARPS